MQSLVFVGRGVLQGPFENLDGVLEAQFFRQPDDPSGARLLQMIDRQHDAKAATAEVDTSAAARCN
jgi:hypothetical protein